MRVWDRKKCVGGVSVREFSVSPCFRCPREQEIGAAVGHVPWSRAGTCTGHLNMRKPGECSKLAKRAGGSQAAWVEHSLSYSLAV